MRVPYREARSGCASPSHRKANETEAEQEGGGGFRHESPACGDGIE